MKEEIQKAVEVLRKGGIILYPTDTIWGIGCDAANTIAIEKIYTLKKRTDSKSMLALVDNADRISHYVKKIPHIARDLIELSNKPLTIIYPDAVNLPDNLLAEDGSIGIRVVQHEFCQQLIFTLNRPLVSTSANVSGEKIPSTFAEISDEIINSVDYVIDPRFEEKVTHKPSSIIKLGISGEVKIIRK
ncbi:MAG: threonylcarbamoyl-AMP synthase [Prevotellaceae bacterium]|jgi:L-threonylcarbamoyladenylate synthase|nr:threonylcarbamoyl-AMP synthase [Prevotellaceae bacterium]